MTKTIKEWFQELPSPIREKALKYAEEDWSLDRKKISLSDAVSCWFIWEKTDEWRDYWSEYNSKLKKQEQPNLPDTLEINGILYKRV